jgi:pimeloyl-ACP methyl ester carboxylesterase
VPYARIERSPISSRSPIDLYYRDLGIGPPLVILHGGWGYEFYPHDDAIAKLPCRFLIPDRTGYGKSPRIERLPPRFHTGFAIETERFLDALGITRCVLWGHSDGAIIATILALRHPERYAGLVLEALHLDREKPRSHEFFEQMAHDPDAFGDKVTRKLAAEHGDDYWRTIISADGRAWLDIATSPQDDFFDRPLSDLKVPTLVVHGTEDPRTEPGELDRIRPVARIELIEGAGHSPHSEREFAAKCTAIVGSFLEASRPDIRSDATKENV